ncbi:MAG: PQQ-binding-like beta-propeller repeat protein [Muribaculaceae bacterium]|nr:PQQ-binding-like beta-propeller repeat protein [Muribaculaceae bacterium]
MKKIAVIVFAAAAACCASAQRIAVLSDIHVTPGNENDRQLRRAVDEINTGAFDYVVVNGDLSNEGSDAELANVKSILDGIRLPIAVLPGNHENNWSQSATKTFVDTWGNDRFLRTVGPDSLTIVGINCGPYMKMGDGHVKQEDLHWLRAELQRAADAGRRILSFNHYPLREDDLDNWQEYVALLQQFPVIGHINGHYHSWQEYRAGGIPAVMTRALDMRDGTYGYAILDITPDWVHVYDKSVGAPAVPRFAFATTHTNVDVAGAAPSWEAPEGFEVQKVWADSASVFTRVAVDAERVYFGNSLGEARAVDRHSGELVWSVPTGASLFGRPVLLPRNRVSIPTATGLLIADCRTGRVLKTLPSREGPYVADGIADSATGDLLTGGYKRFERRRPDGRLRWSYDSLFNYCQAAPVLDGEDIIFGAWDTNLRCLDARTGRLRWVWNNGKSANMLGPGNVVPVVTPERVYVVAPDRYMTAIDRRTGATIWRDNSHRYRESLGRSADGTRVYAKTMDGELVAVDASAPDFRELWTVDLGLGYDHAPCIVAEQDGVVYAGSRRGLLTAVDPQERRVLWQLPLGVSEINGIDVDPATGSVFVSLIEGTVFRVSRPAN